MKLIRTTLFLLAFAVTSIFAQDMRAIETIEGFEGDAATWGVVNTDKSVSPAANYYFFELNNHVLVILATLRLSEETMLDMVKSDEALYTELMKPVADEGSYTVYTIMRKAIAKGEYNMSTTLKGKATAVK
jgi:hypothetical protein